MDIFFPTDFTQYGQALILAFSCLISDTWCFLLTSSLVTLNYNVAYCLLADIMSWKNISIKKSFLLSSILPTVRLTASISAIAKINPWTYWTPAAKKKKKKREPSSGLKYTATVYSFFFKLFLALEAIQVLSCLSLTISISDFNLFSSCLLLLMSFIRLHLCFKRALY